jgi:hypothetical protein
MYKDIKKSGYIPYPSPMQFAGTGTLVSGSPKKLNLMAHPQTCFPDNVDDHLTQLRFRDNTVFPTRKKSFTTQGSVNVDLLNFLNTGNGMIGTGVNFKTIQTISLSMEGVEIEYMDALSLTRHYRETMSDLCKEYLQQVVFIIQAIKVEKMVFKFYNENGVGIRVNADNIQQFLDLGLDLSYRFSDEYTLVIDSPKYIGYQLGSLRESDNGMALYRANSVKNNKFQFKSLKTF